MSNTKNTGGSAFPIPNVDHVYDGMTLRDYFAAKAMASIYGWHNSEDSLAKEAYIIADAMLKARNQ